MMIDFHTHLLPAIDDGSRDLAMTECLLKQEAIQGVATIVATPHFYAEQTSFDRFLQKRALAVDEVVQAGLAVTTEENTGKIRIIPAAEVYYFRGMGRADRIRELCVVGSDLLLLEMPFTQWDEAVVRDVRELIEKQHLRIVLVHIERFIRLQKDKRYLEQILAMPVILQINAGSMGSWGERRLIKKIISYHKPLLLGSDCHSPHRRPVNIETGMQILESKIEKGISRQMMETARSLLGC